MYAVDIFLHQDLQLLILYHIKIKINIITNDCILAPKRNATSKLPWKSGFAALITWKT